MQTNSDGSHVAGLNTWVSGLPDCNVDNSIRDAADAYQSPQYNKATSWKSAEQFCQRQRMRLCSYDEICPNGPENPPEGGLKEGGDYW
jgi:hypothetical protein